MYISSNAEKHTILVYVKAKELAYYPSYNVNSQLHYTALYILIV